jgi:beta-glucosidase
MRIRLPGGLTLLCVAACTTAPNGPDGVTRAAALLPYQDPSQPVATRVEDLLARMSLDDKLGQMTQADRGYEAPYVDPSEATAVRLGSMLSGGDSGPVPTPTPTAWADTYDAFQRAALATPLHIPLLYGVDAVHGNANVLGATVYPHNLGLGASRDPALVQAIGRATAEEIAATGLDWTYSPVVAVTRDDHWGRVYESFGEIPELPSMMTSLITGLQGDSLASPTSVLATAKHFIGDGGTNGGVDEGETTLSEADLRAIHLPPFRAAVERHVAAVMVSYSSWNGAKAHGHHYLITDLLKGELGYGGIVITDWDGIELLDGHYGFSGDDVRQGVNAGIDVFMITRQYGNFINILRTEVQAGRVSMARIDDANRRILRKKFELGLFERPFADRSLLPLIGSVPHRELARRAVQESQVVLKNEGVLPLRREGLRVFVAGKAADNIGTQCGGWTIKWQGGSGATQPGTSILAGIRRTVAPSSTVSYSIDGSGIDASYDVAIAVIGETPYAEYEGDRTDDLRLDATDQATLARLKASGVPVVTVLVSGRPLDVSREIPSWSAFVASWLPGTEGEGVADVLFGVVAPTGKLPLTWMQTAAQEPINVGDGKVPLFPFGAGLTYAAVPGDVPPLPPRDTDPPPPPPPGFDARATIRAEAFTAQSGTQLEACGEPGCGQDVGWITPGDWLAFDDVDFGSTSPARFQARMASDQSSGFVDVHLDATTGPIIATLPASPTGGWTAWVTRDVALTASATGRHRVVLVFRGPGPDFVNLEWLRFI